MSSTDNDNSSSDGGLMVLWTLSANQKAFLIKMLPMYKSAFGKKVLNEYWALLFQEWFKSWPTEVEMQLKS
ncbi:hypothetical protein BDN71DRAFT_1508715 [Pleurotus eryngii]|uniref:Uncharacterized protein n=1 Tax=Pleurotus eryngii TaxID=5323 RepID=A0A9P5ZT34_PLEER|nr:hypothetical protein BDN71DRAFT_1508715 [Pleurotus eryngii]